MSLSPADLAAARQSLADRDPALARAHAQTPPFEWRVRQAGFVGLFRMIDRKSVV